MRSLFGVDSIPRRSCLRRCCSPRRLEPRDGVLSVTARTPESAAGVVLAELHARPGVDVEAGDLLAITESASLLEALVTEAEAAVGSTRERRSSQCLCGRRVRPCRRSRTRSRPAGEPSRATAVFDRGNRAGFRGRGVSTGELSGRRRVGARCRCGIRLGHCAARTQQGCPGARLCPSAHCWSRARRPQLARGNDRPVGHPRPWRRQ